MHIIKFEELSNLSHNNMIKDFSFKSCFDNRLSYGIETKIGNILDLT